MPGMWTPADRAAQQRAREQAGCPADCRALLLPDTVYVLAHRRFKHYEVAVSIGHSVPGGAHLEPRRWYHNEEWDFETEDLPHRPTRGDALSAVANRALLYAAEITTADLGYEEPPLPF